MIQPYQYLKDVYTMSDSEKRELAKRVAMTESGENDTSLDFDLITLSALPRAHGFISMAHQLDSDRVWKEIQGFLKLLKALLPSVEEVKPSVRKSATCVPENKESVPKATESVTKTTESVSKEEKLKTLKGDRPQHFDAWLDLMSDNLRAKIATLPELHTQKNYYRQIVEKLEANPNHSKQDMSLAASLTVNYEKKILSIYNMADIEWEELQKREVSKEVKMLAKQGYDDAEKNIHKIEKILETEQEKQEEEQKEKTVADMSEEELGQLTVAQLLASDMSDGPRQYFLNKRIEMARGYLKKMTPETLSEEQKQKAMGYVQELADAGKPLSPKAKENLKAAGLMNGNENENGNEDENVNNEA